MKFLRNTAHCKREEYTILCNCERQQLLPQSASLTAPSEREPSLPPPLREVPTVGGGGSESGENSINYLLENLIFASVFEFRNRLLEDNFRRQVL